jgi:REP element-mobilizing transposase RayT
MIDAATRDFLTDFFRRTIIRERAELIQIAILKTHVHLLIRTPPRFDLPHLLQLLKGGSSYAASRARGNILGLRWNKAYSVTTVSPRALARAVEYLNSQDARHPDEAIPS